MTIELKRKLPPLYATENTKDSLVICRFFLPGYRWTWYAIEFDGQNIFWGYVAGDYPELGYFSLSEIEAARGNLGQIAERGRYFQPQPFSQVQKLHE